MSVPRGPGPPGERPTPVEDTLSPAERGHDVAREAFVEGLAELPPRPLTRDEKEAARHDPGLRERVYAPASKRVPRRPAPGHAELIERGLADETEERRRGAEEVARETGATPPDLA